MIRFFEEPRRCSYLRQERARFEYLAANLTAAEYSELLSRGYRRFGCRLFRPACPSCRQCLGIRVPVQRFRLSRSQRRVLKANGGIRVELAEVSVSREHLKLYAEYHSFMSRERGWPAQDASERIYRDTFLECAGEHAKEWRFYQGDRLVGVDLMDEVEDSISMVYFFHHPSWRRQSPGTFSILKQIEYARVHGLDFAYLGYWIGANQSMSYKTRFRPYQLLRRFPSDAETPDWLEDRAAVGVVESTMG